MSYDTQSRTTPLPAVEPPIRQVAEQVGHLWWIPLVAGLLSIGLGLAVLASDWTVKALVVLTGVLLVIRGLAIAFNPSYASDRAGEQVGAGIVGIIIGIVLIAWPAPTLLVLAIVFGVWLAISGGFHIVTSIARRHHMAQWGLGVAIGVVELLLGLWVMRRPEVTLTLVITIIGLWTVITGVIFCVQAFEVRAALRAVGPSTPPPTIDVTDRRTGSTSQMSQPR